MVRKGVCFARVRPFINKPVLSSILLKKECLKNLSLGNRYTEKDRFLFSSGRASLKWLLSILRQRTRRPLRVGVQALTCQVVPQAILESKNYPVFFDITPKYFTTLLENIDFENIDVLILTHLYGIPNPDYFEICEISKSRNVFVIDDLALTYKSTIRGKEIGTASDASFYSFGFDKPVSCYQGGLLEINNEELANELHPIYEKVRPESDKRQINDLRKLRIFHELFDRNIYMLGGVYEIDDFFLTFIDFFQSNTKNIYRKISLSNKIVNKINRLCFHKFWRNRNPIRIYRMGRLKSYYLNTLWDLYPDVHIKRLLTGNKAKQKIESEFKDTVFPTLPNDIQPSWHRLPMLVPEAKRSQIIQWGRRNGIEIGAYNWGILSFEPFHEFDCLNPDKFPNSNLVKKQILNLPIWAEDIWQF
jgi:dTDP-4-amino-4,6-dideoxygalactose transaminase